MTVRETVCVCEWDCVCVCERESACVCLCVCVCVLPLARPGMWHTADNGGEHQGSDKREENQVDETLHPIITEPSQSLNVVLGREKERMQLLEYSQCTVPNVCYNRFNLKKRKK